MIWPGSGWGLFSNYYFPGSVLDAGEFAKSKVVLFSSENIISGASEHSEYRKGY